MALHNLISSTSSQRSPERQMLAVAIDVVAQAREHLAAAVRALGAARERLSAVEKAKEQPVRQDLQDQFEIASNTYEALRDQKAGLRNWLSSAKRRVERCVQAVVRSEANVDDDVALQTDAWRAAIDALASDPDASLPSLETISVRTQRRENSQRSLVRFVDERKLISSVANHFAIRLFSLHFEGRIAS